MLCQYLISLLFFIVILILSLPYIKPFLAMLLLIHKILHCLTPDFPSVSFPAPSPPSPLDLVTWVFFFFLAPQTCKYLVSRDSALTQSVHLAVLGSSFMSWGLRASLSSCFHAYFIVPGLWLCPTSLP